MNTQIYELSNESYLNKSRTRKYILNHYNKINKKVYDPDSKSFVDAGQLVTSNDTKQIKDVYDDLLYFVDKDIENYFMAIGGE